jgi:hypothetical protein
MDITSLNQFIKKALEYYDSMREKYNDYMKESVKYNNDTNEIEFGTMKKNFTFETLGYFDNTEGVWVWSWIMNDIGLKDINMARGLLNYGLELEPGTVSDEQHMIKSLLVNSRIKIEELEQLDVNLAIYCYLLKNRFTFLYPKKVYLDGGAFVTFYLLIK